MDVCDIRNLSEFNAMSTKYVDCLSSTRIVKTSSKIPNIQGAMDRLDYCGCIVTADTLSMQKETVRAIIDIAHGDYYLALKENQKTAYAKVQKYFADELLLEGIMTTEGRNEETATQTLLWEYFIYRHSSSFADRTWIGAVDRFLFTKKSATIHTKPVSHAATRQAIVDIFPLFSSEISFSVFSSCIPFV